MSLHIVLYQPLIPANTGNIGRTCVATGTRLHLIEPLGFRLNEKSIKRAGIDYWEHLDVTRYINFEDFLEKNPGAKIYMATTKGQHVYTEVNFEPDCYIMFGKESIYGQSMVHLDDKKRIILPKFTGATQGDRLVLVRNKNYLSIHISILIL